MHGVSANFHADALLQADSQYRDALFGMTFLVASPRCDRPTGILILFLFLIRHFSGGDLLLVKRFRINFCFSLNARPIDVLQ